MARFVLGKTGKKVAEGSLNAYQSQEIRKLISVWSTSKYTLK